MMEKLNTLVLTLCYPHRASYYLDWADAFEAAPFFSTSICNLYELKRQDLARRLHEHDLVVILHACTADSTRELDRVSTILAERDGPRLLAFVGNEYNSPYAPISEKISVLHSCRPDVIATQLMAEAGRYLYEGMDAEVISVPHALNPAIFRPGAPDAQRPIDIGVRNFRYSPLLGDEERNCLIEHFQQNGEDYGFNMDIENGHRFSRQEWANFLCSCRGTISSEAGSWYLDRDDSLVKKIAAHIGHFRSSLVISDAGPMHGLLRRLPLAVKDALAWLLRNGPVKYAAFEDLTLDFEELNELFFKNAPRCPVYPKAISSRHLDAVGTKTSQILIRGYYNDVLKADEHYIPVSVDLCDISEAVERFKDSEEHLRIAAQAYDHVMSNHTYAHRMAILNEFIRSL